MAEELHVKFQGGFVGKTCTLQVGNSVEDLKDLFTFYPEDISSEQVSNIKSLFFLILNVILNTMQIFTIPNNTKYTVYKIILKDSSDFFGRITIYSLQLFSKN